MARRMGGTDKLTLLLGGETVLDRVLMAASCVTRPLVVVGPERPTPVSDVAFVQEQPSGGGPVPAVRAGLHLLGEPAVVLVLAGDLPFVTADALRVLLEALRDDPEAEAAAAVDGAGRPNPLLAAYRGPALRRATRRLGAGAGVAASRLLPEKVAVVDLGPETTLNVNSPQDLERATRLASQR